MADVLILCYHAVSPTWTADLSAFPEQLERQLDLLLERGYAPVTMTEAIRGPRAPRKLAVTFDDGFESVHRLAWPILRERGIPGTLFVPTALAGEGRTLAWEGTDHWVGGESGHELLSMSWDEVRELRADGWEIGSHTRTHPHLTQLDDDLLREELEGSKAELEAQMGERCTSIAYPYGDHDDRVVEAAARAGYDVACTLPGRWPSRWNRLRYPRFGVYNADDVGDVARRTRPLHRRATGTPLWTAATYAIPRARRVQRALRDREPAHVFATPAPTPNLRLLAPDPLVVGNRVAVAAGGLAGRAGLATAYTLWPRVDRPIFAVEAGHRQGADWLLRTFEPSARRIARVDPAAWSAVRARGLLLPGTGGAALHAAERVIGRPLDHPRLAMFSPSGGPLAKATCFVFEADAPSPMLVVKGMATPSQAHRLRTETERVEELRSHLAAYPDVVDALPLPPLFAGELDGDYLVVQDVDPAASGTANAGRTPALDWLRRFVEASAGPERAWDEDDVEAALSWIGIAWGRGRPEQEEAVRSRVGALTRELLGGALPVCAVHGDFWRGNIGHADGQLRIYDWEWTQPHGRPLFDLWSYELGELRDATQAGDGDAALLEAARAALARVEADLGEWGLDPRFARASLAPALAELSFRLRQRTGGGEGNNEVGAVRLMRVIEPLLDPQG